MIKKQKPFFNATRNAQAKFLKAKRQEEIKALGLKLQAQGLSTRKVHKEIKSKGYKIGYHNLFYLLKSDTD